MSSPSRKVLRFLIYGVLLSAAAAASWYGYTGDSGSFAGLRGGRPASAVAVETVAVERVTVRDIRRFTGTLLARAFFDVASKTSGRLVSLTVDIGDLVEKGQVVARLDDEELVQQELQSEAERGVAQAALQEAHSLLKVREKQLLRSEKLSDKGIGSESALEAARTDVISQQARVQVAQAQLTQREAALRAAKVRLSYSVIRLDWSGDGGPRVVGERYVNEGEMLTANKPIFSVLDIDAVTAVVYATEADYGLLRGGQEVSVVADGLPDRHFTGHIARLAPQFQQESRQARMEITIPNPQRLLKPGMYVRVGVEVSRAEGAAVVPVASVVTRNGGQGVFLVEGDPALARFVPVHTGLVQGDRVQVLEPSLTGRVVSLGQHLLQDGAAVRLVGEGLEVQAGREAGAASRGAANPKPVRGKKP